jgi:hypothetical protein
MAVKAVREVRKQEKLHLDWNEQTLTRLAMESATETASGAMVEGADSSDSEQEELDRGEIR